MNENKQQTVSEVDLKSKVGCFLPKSPQVILGTSCRLEVDLGSLLYQVGSDWHTKVAPRSTHINTEVSQETHTEEDTSDKPHINTEVSQETHTGEDTSDKPHISTELSQETNTEEDTSDKVASSLLRKGRLVLKIIIFCRSV